MQISKQFGDNFKIFNEGLKKLIEWQDKYILEVEETKKSIDEANKIFIFLPKMVPSSLMI